MKGPVESTLAQWPNLGIRGAPDSGVGKPRSDLEEVALPRIAQDGHDAAGLHPFCYLNGRVDVRP